VTRSQACTFSALKHYSGHFPILLILPTAASHAVMLQRLHNGTAMPSEGIHTFIWGHRRLPHLPTGDDVRDSSSQKSAY
jgi:hypothetical protein